jgi:hypothetical protein
MKLAGNCPNGKTLNNTAMAQKAIKQKAAVISVLIFFFMQQPLFDCISIGRLFYSDGYFC